MKSHRSVIKLGIEDLGYPVAPPPVVLPDSLKMRSSSIGSVLGAGCLLAVSCWIPLRAGELTLTYKVYWRFWHAGNVRLSYITPPKSSSAFREAVVDLRTHGFVDALYNVHNHYTVLFDKDFCADSSRLDLQEGKKRRRITVVYQEPPGTVRYREVDLTRHRVSWTNELDDVPYCVHDELAALARLRSMKLKPGDRLELPVSNGKKFIMARVDILRREPVKLAIGSYQTLRCEAYLFNNRLYRRKGRLLFWLTDDARKIPVRIRVKLSFYIGTITLNLVKLESR